MSVFRRFFVASDMIKEILTQGGIRQPSFSGQEVSPPTSNGSNVPDDSSVPPHLGGLPPISGTRPTRTASRTNTKRRDAAAADRYKFPS